MKKLIGTILFTVILLTGCSSVSVKKSESDGKATMYGSEYNGRKTASGDIYNKDSLTAAVKDVAFGTKIRVENVANKKSVYVVVNDRGPKQDGWLVTLSEAAFNKISNGEKYIDVKIEIVE